MFQTDIIKPALDAKLSRIQTGSVGMDLRTLAETMLSRHDEDWTWVDPEDVKRLARAVLSK